MIVLDLQYTLIYLVNSWSATPTKHYKDPFFKKSVNYRLKNYIYTIGYHKTQNCVIFPFPSPSPPPSFPFTPTPIRHGPSYVVVSTLFRSCALQGRNGGVERLGGQSVRGSPGEVRKGFLRHSPRFREFDSSILKKEFFNVQFYTNYVILNFICVVANHTLCTNFFSKFLGFPRLW